MDPRQQFSIAFSFLRRGSKRPHTIDPITLPEIPVAVWNAAASAAFMRGRVDETHGIMRWAPAGRADAKMVAGHRYRLRYLRRPAKPLPQGSVAGRA